MRYLSLSMTLITLACPGAGLAEPVDYLRDIKPFLASRCYACHGALKQKAELRVDTAKAILQGGKHGPVVIPGNLDKSLLLARISTTDETERMPQEGDPLSAAQIDLIKAWIRKGAPVPVDEQSEKDPRDHWAFQPPKRPALPASIPDHGVRNPLDLFIGAAQRRQGLKPVPEVSRALLLRRVYLDLTGLPPTPEALRDFLQDASPLAYEKVVDRLLASPSYGERWARHWMDIWRYSDWYGLGDQLRYSQKHIWHWREWIMESLNHDKGYDRMIREMLAGDEIAPMDAEVLRATGFLARGYYLFNRNTWLDDTIEHTFKAFGGLTINCAKCHDHKFDPFTQSDYYHLRAYFEPYHVRLDPLPGEPNLENNGLPRIYDQHADRPTFLFVRGNEKQPDTNHVYGPAVPPILNFQPAQIQPVALPAPAFAPSLLPYVEGDHLAAANREVQSAMAQLDKSRKVVADLEKQSSLPDPDPVNAAPAFHVHETFDAAAMEAWKPGAGKWHHEAGRLIQQESGDVRSFVRLEKPVPRDFSARVRFRIQGGARWRSVGIAFDAAEGREVLVYLSASEGAKLQVAYKSGGGAYAYPAEGAQLRAVPLDQSLELRILVCHQLVNVAVNGEFALAYRLPIPRQVGSLDLITYDATAAFEEAEVASLDIQAALVDPKSGKPIPASRFLREVELEKARSDLAFASQTLDTARLRTDAFRAAFAADRARFQDPPSANADELSMVASLTEKKYNLVRAEQAVLSAERDLTRAPTAKSKDLEKKVAEARAAHEKARQESTNQVFTYTSPRVSRKAFEGPTETEAMLPSVYPRTSTGRRTALADWFTDRRNPLTARVAVNHVWTRHFGEPLVPSVFDFGRKSPPPAIPELVDWLAVELMDHNWSLKHIHRLIVTSAAYRRGSSTVQADPATKSADPDNRFWWRRPSIRMDAQTLRDSLLFLAGDLDPAIGGPTVNPKAQEGSRRRSLYFTHSQEDQHRFLEVFDNAKVLECYRRLESIVPQQALALFNSKLVLEMASRIERRLDQQGNLEADAFVRRAFEAILSRAPTTEEREAARQALESLETLHREEKHDEAPRRARANLVHALLNHNDFITIR